MNNTHRQQLIDTSWALHSDVENAYLAHPASKGADDWQEKQRLLLADMAIHLLQTALKPGELPLDKLQNNLHAILTISDQFLPQAGLKKATEGIYQSSGDNA
ncbi:hypothetical protein [Alteromonas lipolytica]|uniref:Uncharacterized protein n=1 Tax=Alteromonas lipolytica TaxID=1856405 RepID=A0A1E8FII1_9ALTE|nr:hypothetical protein [Alteromonas lipolytica]OFI35741.1 hypothetical protein BFC17_10670 [Alteromonas lipolytica]GGF80392.1 hypothetical protein GCM10011338_35810 [Alteromonas lipolytica]